MNWIDRIPTGLLALVTVFMMFAPFSPEPHLVQKFNMLMSGNLHKPLDIFDVFWHLLPAALLVIKLVRARR